MVEDMDKSAGYFDKSTSRATTCNEPGVMPDPP
jgi:hypothetical protein